MTNSMLEHWSFRQKLNSVSSVQSSRCVRDFTRCVQVHTYAVSDVKDPLTGTDISFTDAVRRGIVDRETGDYVNRHSGERLAVSEAIQRGLVSARLLSADDQLLTLGHTTTSLHFQWCNVFSKL